MGFAGNDLYVGLCGTIRAPSVNLFGQGCAVSALFVVVDVCAHIDRGGTDAVKHAFKLLKLGVRGFFVWYLAHPRSR